VIRLAKQYGRYGYRKIHELLQIEGLLINHKKVERIWREEGLQLPARHKRRKRLHHHNASIIQLRPYYPNHVWSIDFVHDKLSNGRPYKMLTVLDEYTREALAVTVANKMGSSEVLEALYPILLKRGKPDYLRSDNGPEFSSQPFTDWLTKVGIKPIRIYPGSPWGETVNKSLRWSDFRSNGYCESFNSKLRDELLNGEILYTLKEVKIVIETWRRRYNTIRPHSSLRYQPPAPEVLQWPAP